MGKTDNIQGVGIKAAETDGEETDGKAGREREKRSFRTKESAPSLSPASDPFQSPSATRFENDLANIIASTDTERVRVFDPC